MVVLENLYFLSQPLLIANCMIVHIKISIMWHIIFYIQFNTDASVTNLTVYTYIYIYLM